MTSLLSRASQVNSPSHAQSPLMGNPFALRMPDVNRTFQFQPAETTLALDEKYRPPTLADIVGQGEAIEQLSEFVETPYSNCFLFSGPTGVGKTTAAMALARDLGVDPFWGYLKIKSGECTRDNVRDALKSLRQRCMGDGSGWKLVLVDEADRMSKAAADDFLSALEEITASYDKAVIVFTTNHPESFETAFLHRCTHIPFRAEASTMLQDAQVMADRVWAGEGAPGVAPRVETLPGIVDSHGNLSLRIMVKTLAPRISQAKKLATLNPPSCVTEKTPVAGIPIADVRAFLASAELAEVNARIEREAKYANNQRNASREYRAERRKIQREASAAFKPDDSTPVTRNLQADVATAEPPSVETVPAVKTRAKRPYVKRGPRRGKLADSLAKLGDFIPTLPTPAPIEPEQPQSRALRLIGSTRLGLRGVDYSPSLEWAECEIDVTTPGTRNPHEARLTRYWENMAPTIRAQFQPDDYMPLDFHRSLLIAGALAQRNALLVDRLERKQRKAARAEASTPLTSNPPARDIKQEQAQRVIVKAQAQLETRQAIGRRAHDEVIQLTAKLEEVKSLLGSWEIILDRSVRDVDNAFKRLRKVERIAKLQEPTPPVDPTPDMGKETPVTDTQEKPIMPIGWSESFSTLIKDTEYTVSRRDIPGLRSYKVENGRSDYDVDETNSGRATCSCPDYRARHADLPFTSGCKHIQALVAAGKLTNEFPKIEETPVTQAATPVASNPHPFDATIDDLEAKLEGLKAVRADLRRQLELIEETIRNTDARILALMNNPIGQY